MILVSGNSNNWPAKWFTPEEIIKKSQYGTFIMNKKLEDTLYVVDIIREIIGQPVYITDACRFTGSETSQHFFKAPFNALDIWTPGYSSADLIKILEEHDLGTGRGLYPYGNGFIHVDCRRGKSSKEGRVSRWYRDQNGVYHSCGPDYDGLLE